MKVLCVNATLDPVMGGGTAERTFQLSRNLALSGVECSVLTLDVGLTANRIAGLSPAKVTALHCISRRYFLFGLPEPRIAELVENSDVVHLMGHWTLLNALVCNEARRQAKPYVVCPAGALPIYGRSRYLKHLYNRLAGLRCIREAARCVAVAENEFEHFAAYGIPADRVVLIPNGIEPAEFSSADDRAFRKKFGLPDSDFILFMGRLDPIKGPDLLLEAYASIASRHPDASLVFAGPDGGLLAALRSSVRKHRLTERVHFIGPVRGEDKSRAYHAASVLAIPSRQEAMSIVVLEGGICGTPVLITDRCGFNDIEKSGGGVVVPATVEGLATGLGKLLSTRQELQGMGRRLQNFTSENFLWSAVIGRYLGLFEELLQPR